MQALGLASTQEHSKMLFPLICVSHNTACLSCACLQHGASSAAHACLLLLGQAKQDLSMASSRAYLPWSFPLDMCLSATATVRPALFFAQLAGASRHRVPVCEFEFEQKNCIEFEDAGRVLRLRIGLNSCRHDGASTAHLGRPKRGLHRIYETIYLLARSL